MATYGMDKDEVVKELKQYINKEPDLKYYLDNEYIERMIELLIEGIGCIIEKNNRKVEEDKLRELRMSGRRI
ncbi:MAG: hypothetical protein IJB71_04320 [Bacilli bacterium]|nr:hypothetical protein [Bacilli bacterium]